MLVYMIINMVTEMAYIGLTTGRMRTRLKGHLRCARGRALPGLLYDAMRAWPIECWEAVILEHCDTVPELLVAERRWIQECETHLPNVGYNDSVPDEKYASSFVKQYPGPYERSKELGWLCMSGWTDFATDEYSREIGRLMGSKGAATVSKPKGVSGKRKEDMTPEEINYFKEAGRRSVEARGIDFYRECGKKGGAAKHEKPGDSEEMRRRAALGRSRKVKASSP